MRNYASNLLFPPLILTPLLFIVLRWGVKDVTTVSMFMDAMREQFRSREAMVRLLKYPTHCDSSSLR